MISGFVLFGGTNHAISFSPSLLVSVTSCACGKPAAAGGVRVGSGKYINARWNTYIRPSTPPKPTTAIKSSHFSAVICSHNTGVLIEGCCREPFPLALREPPGRTTMPRLRYIEENEKTPHARELIESAKRTGAPDPRVVSIMTRSVVVSGWVEYWNKVLYHGVLSHKLKDICRINSSVAHQCGYCSTVRSNVARNEGLTEDMVSDLFDYENSKHFTPR